MALAIVLGLSGVIAAAPHSASAESGSANAYVRAAQTWFAYLNAGESIDLEFGKVSTDWSFPTHPKIIVTSPAGAEEYACEMARNDPNGKICSFAMTAPTSGVWSVAIVDATGDPNTSENNGGKTGVAMSWRIDVLSAGVSIPGRLWTERYAIRNSGTTTNDMTLFYLSEQGFQYEVLRRGLNGIDSVYTADAFGNRDADGCSSARSSTYYAASDVVPGSRCPLTPFKIFFSKPSPDLPSTVTLPAGTQTWLTRDPVMPTLAEPVFMPSSPGSPTGTLSVSATDFEGTVRVLIDTDGDGDFSGAGDREEAIAVIAGAGEYEFDGLDAAGGTIPATVPVGFRVRLDSYGEIHLNDEDAELLVGGVSVTRLNGPEDGHQSRIFWDDTFPNTADPQATVKCSSTPQLSALEGIDSSTGVHGWGWGSCTPSGALQWNPWITDLTNGGTWGNNRYIDNWAFVDADLEAETVVPVGAVEVSKTSDPVSGSTVEPGQTVTYTLTYVNVGDGVGVLESSDDLSGVLDDADMRAEPTVAGAGASTVTAVRDGAALQVSGYLEPGLSASVSYAVTVKSASARGDGALMNVVVPGGGSVCSAECETTHPVGQPLQVLKVGEASTGAVVPMDGSAWAIYSQATGGLVVDVPRAVDGATGLFGTTAGLAPGTYWLEETTALEGFQLLPARVEFAIAPDGSLTLGESSPHVSLITVGDIPTIRVEDVPAYTLPATGGPGSAPFIAIGASVFILALVIVFRRNRNRNRGAIHLA